MFCFSGWKNISLVLCLQETKVEDQLFPSWELELAGYKSYWYGQKTYNGVAIPRQP